MRATERAERVDRDLVEQAQRGDREAFAILARTRGDLLFGSRAASSATSTSPRTRGRLLNCGRLPGQSGNASGPRSDSSRAWASASSGGSHEYG